MIDIEMPTIDYMATINQQSVEITRLRAEVESLTKECGMGMLEIANCRSEIDRLRAEVERLRSVLRGGVLMLSEMGLSSGEKCQMAYDHMSAALTAQEKTDDKA